MQIAEPQTVSAAASNRAQRTVALTALGQSLRESQRTLGGDAAKWDGALKWAAKLAPGATLEEMRALENLEPHFMRAKWFTERGAFVLRTLDARGEPLSRLVRGFLRFPCGEGAGGGRLEANAAYKPDQETVKVLVELAHRGLAQDALALLAEFLQRHRYDDAAMAVAQLIEDEA